MCASKVSLYILNTILLLLGLGLAITSIWFFVQVHMFTSLRNGNHYLLDYTVYWPQAIPWMFFVVGLLVVCVASCGYASAKKNRKSIAVMYLVFLAVVIVALVAAAIVALVFADSSRTDNFIKDTVWDAFYEMKNNMEIADAYANIEKKLQCCGASSPRDYKSWKDELPISCCDVYYHGWVDNYPIDCGFTSKLANERYGCSVVAVQYTRIIIKVLAGTSLLIALIAIISAIVATASIKTLQRKKSRPIPVQYELESKKVLL